MPGASPKSEIKGWIEYIADNTNASFFAPSLIDSESLLVPTICLHEVFERVLQEFGEERALDAIEIMPLGTIIDIDRQISNELKLPMADSIILATARSYDSILWTQDEHFKGIEGVKYKEKKTKSKS